jgi:hypothetical protein
MTLLQYLKSYLGTSLETQLNYSDSSYDSVIADTLLIYGIDTEDEATDTMKLYKLGVYFLWKKIYRESLLNIDFSADGVNLKNSQISENALSQLKLATSDALQYLPGNVIKFYQLHPECHFNEFSVNYRRW